MSERKKPPEPELSLSRAPELGRLALQHAHSHPHGDHAHSHSHSHLHDEGSHEHAFPEAQPSGNTALPEGSGRGRVLLFDTASGIAGDMTVAALLDLGVPFAVVERAAQAVGLSGCGVSVVPARSGAIGGSRFVVEVTGKQPQRTYAQIAQLLERAPLEPGCALLAQRIFRRLAEAESEVHRIPLDSVAFHEVGAVDAILDIVCAAACFAHVGARVVSTPLPLGRGFVKCQHGILPLPAPATVLCLRGVPTYDARIESELVTPTGAAIIATVAEQFLNWPTFSPERVGWGCGTRVLPDRTNALRVVLGEGATQSSDQSASTHVLLEANVDDMTGELVAHAIDALLNAGALDAWAAPVTMKKGRPGLVVAAIASREQERAVAHCLLRETTSIGVRHSYVARTERPRRVVEVTTPFGNVPIKISSGDFGPPLAKPEFDACAALARQAGVPVRQVLEAALAAYAQLSSG